MSIALNFLSLVLIIAALLWWPWIPDAVRGGGGMVAAPTLLEALSAREAGNRFAIHWAACYARRQGRWCLSCEQYEADLIRATDAELDAELDAEEGLLDEAADEAGLRMTTVRGMW